MLKTGDKLYCKKSIEGKYTANKQYVVTGSKVILGMDPYEEGQITNKQYIKDMEVILRNDGGYSDSFGEKGYLDSWTRLFYTEQEYREIKLGEILNA